MITAANLDLCKQHETNKCGDYCPYCQVKELKAQLAYKTLQWEGVKDMLAQATAQREEVE